MDNRPVEREHPQARYKDIMMDDFTQKQYTYWDGECKKYQKLFIQNSFKDITEEEKNLYSYAMWYCQEQRAKYR